MACSSALHKTTSSGADPILAPDSDGDSGTVARDEPLRAGDPAGVGDSRVSDAAIGDPTMTHLACDLLTQTTVQTTTVALLHSYIGNGDSLTVVDVREPSETASGIIAGALLYPWSSGVLEALHASLPSDRPLSSSARAAVADSRLSANRSSAAWRT